MDQNNKNNKTLVKKKYCKKRKIIVKPQLVDVFHASIISATDYELFEFIDVKKIGQGDLHLFLLSSSSTTPISLISVSPMAESQISPSHYLMRILMFELQPSRQRSSSLVLENVQRKYSSNKKKLLKRGYRLARWKKDSRVNEQ
ncbi:hypothetical protein Glove_346g83 [Diversispora epigaea]|uniref:Uncharacterized protein n=1 Tax=Diversispora epigaea TaxID=1348612 RepID=A0A397HF25_9GLOM|nr:hypothetical protein Glove_346g83 [Diversispora epigaea]